MKAFFICPPRIIVTKEQFGNPSAYSERYFLPPYERSQWRNEIACSICTGHDSTSSHISTEDLENSFASFLSQHILMFDVFKPANQAKKKKNRSCYFANVRRVDDRRKFGFVFEQCNSTLVCTVCFSLHINIFKTSLVWQLTFLKFNY